MSSSVRLTTARVAHRNDYRHDFEMSIAIAQNPQAATSMRSIARECREDEHSAMQARFFGVNRRFVSSTSSAEPNPSTTRFCPLLVHRAFHASWRTWPIALALGPLTGMALAAIMDRHAVRHVRLNRVSHLLRNWRIFG